ncbi:MAG: S-methyl-5-thioribose-1-phosphate isomerase, partial [Thermodesulfobacteriaceae bacterium]|nr:S-methyl-5-thioribose-1-phosphate isomerase [Thermodesulfobacteriaceae bacterium]
MIEREIPIEPKKVDVIKAFFWTDKALYILDQRKLPHKELFIKAENLERVRGAIKNMLVRGAPAIGIVSAIGFYLGAKELSHQMRFPCETKRVIKALIKIKDKLATTRPTAVNLFWALERMFKKVKKNLSEAEILKKEDWDLILDTLKEEALNIWAEDLEANLKMGEFGAKLLPEGGILTYCNTGALATGGYGTALGVIRKAIEDGKDILVFAAETRPFLQGARLTAWELSKLNLSYKIITDNSVGFSMKRGLIKAVILGADRIARNGDTANKIGTYSLSILAKYHQIPFYVCAPSSTFDLSLSSGKDIPIEERNPKEVLLCSGKRVAPKKANALNLVFDITPAENISGFITEKGIIYPP